MRSLWNDDHGGEVLEYALIAGLIVVAAIGMIGAVGTKLLAYWGSLNSSLRMPRPFLMMIAKSCSQGRN